MTKETDTIEEYKELEVVNIRLVKEPSIIEYSGALKAHIR